MDKTTQKKHKMQCNSPDFPVTKKRVKVRRIAATLLPACLLAVLAVFVFAGLFGYSVFVVGGQSMQPEYPPHSLVVVKKTDLSAVRVGDAIVFKSDALDGKPAFHRVISIEDGGVFTKGDNNAKADNQLITPDSFVGKKAAKITFLAEYLRLISRPSGATFFLFMPLLAAAFVITALRLTGKNRVKANKANRANNEGDK